MGFALTRAQAWFDRRSKDISDADRAFIIESRKAAQRRRRPVQALVGGLIALMALGVAAWWKQDWLKEEIYALD